MRVSLVWNTTSDCSWSLALVTTMRTLGVLGRLSLLV